MPRPGGHYRVECGLCGAVIAQCRCPAVDKAVTHETCARCKVKHEGDALAGSGRSDDGVRSGGKAPDDSEA